MRIAVSVDGAAFAAEWPTLDERRDGLGFHAFQARDYLEAWRDSIGAARGASLVLARVAGADGAPIMLIPFALERRRGLRVLGFPDGGVCDYGAPVLFPAAGRMSAHEMHTLWRDLRTQLPTFDAAIFEKVPEEVGGIANPFRHLAQSPWPGGASYVSLHDSWDAFVATRLHRPKDSRRKRRRLEEMGALRFVVARDDGERGAMLDALVAQKTRRFLELRGADGFERPGYRTYFRHLTERFGAGAVHLSALMLDDAMIATHWGLVANGRFYCLMLANAEGEPARYSPGRLLIEDLIRWSYEAGLSRFDLGIGAAEWKERLGDITQTPLWRAELANSLAGVAYIEGVKLRRRLRRQQAGTPALAAAD